MNNSIKSYIYSFPAILACCVGSAVAQPVEPVLAKKEQPAMLQTMKALVEIESGSASTSPRA